MEKMLVSIGTLEKINEDLDSGFYWRNGGKYNENKQQNTYYINFKNVEINKKGLATVYSTSKIKAKNKFLKEHNNCIIENISE